jgi:predicted nucleotidyltransferase
MHPALDSACQALKLDVPNLRKAAEFSARLRAEMQAALRAELAPTDELDVIVFGSIARQEASTASDLDWVLAVFKLPEDIRRTRKLVEAVLRVQKQLKMPDPGRTGMFGAVMSAADIAERIGLEQDTNLNHSRRILLLQESVSVYSEELHERLLSAVLKRYLVDYTTPKKGIPRFLLNDLLRYWRTIAVDYQAKRWESSRPDWGLRYIKLLISRKLAFAGTVASLFLVENADPNDVSFLLNQVRMPALARLAQLHTKLEVREQEALKEVLAIADEFVGHLEDDSFRDEAKAIPEPSMIKPGSRFAKVRDRARTLQQRLETIFFDSKVLGRHSRTYLSF